MNEHNAEEQSTTMEQLLNRNPYAESTIRASLTKEVLQRDVHYVEGSRTAAALLQVVRDPGMAHGPAERGVGPRMSSLPSSLANALQKSPMDLVEPGCCRSSDYVTILHLTKHISIGVRTIEKYLADEIHPLPCYRLPGGRKRLVRLSDFDRWIAAYRQVGAGQELRETVDEILASLDTRTAT